MSAVVYYMRASFMAPNKPVHRRHKVFRPTKGYYAVAIEDEEDFLSIPCIAEAVNSSRMWRNGPFYPASDPSLEEEISAQEPTPEPVPSVRRGRKKDVRITDSVDQSEIQSERSDSRQERDHGCGVQSVVGVEQDAGTDESAEDVQLRGTELDTDGNDL